MNAIITDMLHKDLLKRNEVKNNGKPGRNIKAFWCSWETAWVVRPVELFGYLFQEGRIIEYQNSQYKISSEFATKRTSQEGFDYMHTGIDRIGTKGTNIYSPFSGRVKAIKKCVDRGYGFSIEIETLWQQNSILYKACHLQQIKNLDIDVKIFAGENIGTMGNTGNCLTYEDGKWRRITETEVSDESCQKGVHLHEMILL